MWQVLLGAAAAAGSGFFAKRFLNANADPNNINVSEETDAKYHFSQEEEEEEQQQQHLGTPKSRVSITHGYDSESETQSCSVVGDCCDGSIFWFSSSETGSRFVSKNSRKKSGNDCGGNRGNVEGFQSTTGFGKVERKCGVLDQRTSGRKLAFCVKKRRTSKNAPGKCGSCSSKDNSIFSLGLGVGIMYIMSAGKTEISRLNTAMDETAKVVQELKTELSRRKSPRNLRVLSSETEMDADLDKIRGKYTQLVPQARTEIRDNAQDLGFLATEEGECASSVFTEEPQQDIMEMDRLEQELESELQKLSWCTTQTSAIEGRISDISENTASAERFYNPHGLNSNHYQLNGVLPSELDQKLCHVLIEQQGSQIGELESELHQAQSKLHEKEAELQALKDCVRRLTEFSLATASDEETEAQLEEKKTNDGVYGNKMGLESKKSVIGMKRAMEFESYSCHMK